MGCSQSKIENEEAVSRCKDRKAFMKSAVSARNAFAAAHISYAMSLKNAGAALSDFAQGEVVNPLSLSSAPVGPTPGGVGPTIGELPSQAPPLPPAVRDLPPPPPPIPDMPPPLQRATSMPERDNKGGSVGGRMETTPSSSNVGTTNNVVGPPPSLPPHDDRGSRTPPPPPPEVNNQTWDYFFNTEDMPGGSLRDDDDMRGEYDRTVYHQRAMRSSGAPATVTTTVPPSIEMVEEMVMPIFSDLDDCFLKASESAHLVSKMLEATRLHYHSNFADNRGHIDHSARVMRVITWNRSFRGLPNAEEFKDDFDSEENETHATVLDKLLAWEKKLYDEVKAGEFMKFDYQRKVALLNKQKKRGANPESLEKTKAAVSHLHTRYIVDMQSMDSTVSEISRLRDEQLYPKLVELVDGMATMWEAMQVHHQNQVKIASNLRLIDISQSTKETTNQHHERTFQLWAIVQEWHTSFEKMVNHQKEYIKALNSWLKLNLIPIESNLKEKVSSPPRPQNPPIQVLLLAWHDHLDKLPDEHAKSAIHNFAALLDTIVQQQEEEMRSRAKVEESRRDLDKKQRHYNKWLSEYMQKKIPNDDADPASIGDEFVHKDELMVEKEFVVENAKKKLEEDTESYERLCTQVREKSLASLKTRLPELFRTLSEFALSASDMYSNLKSLTHSSQSRKQKETTNA
uniref:Nitrate regulatory gene2 protein-like n=1 Tax=Chenopodium quinoa TaxID=63459 RepID=A0A803NAC5_CHEQI